MMLVKIDHLSYSIGEKQLLKDINLVLEENEKIALIGVNGTGKSTLLKLIASFDSHISYKKDISIAYLPQEESFNENNTIYEEAKRLTSDVQEYQITSSLTRFGLTDTSLLIKNLSGGQKKRLSLAITLLKDCDLLILDEPTNHLDTVMIEYLENLLRKRKKAVLMITHDRYFLERVTNRIIELDRGNIYSYIGNYETFLKEKAIREENDLKAQHKRLQFLKKEQEWVRAGVQARSTKSKDRLQRFEKLSSIDLIENVNNVELINTSTRLGKKTIELVDVSKSFGDHLLFHPFSYLFKRYDRIGILGVNGCGKSTLMNMIAGEIEDYSGEIILGETIKIGYFKQGIGEMPQNQRVIDYIRDTSDALVTDEGVLTARNMCERFLFDSTLQYTQIERLSGGEKRRLYLLKVLMEGPNVLLLDEPTNDLDIETLTILEDYLDHFMGIVITVSHDRYFLDKIADGLFVFKDQVITYVNGGYSDSIDISNTKEKKEVKKAERVRVRKKTLTYQETKEMEQLDINIPSTEEEIKSIDQEMEGLTDFSQIEPLTNKRNELEEKLEEMNLRYLELLEKLED